jgi:hypothetical protein
MSTPIDPKVLQRVYGGVEPSADLCWRVEHAQLLTSAQRLQAACEIKHNAVMKEYGRIPPMEKVICIRRLSDL